MNTKRTRSRRASPPPGLTAIALTLALSACSRTPPVETEAGGSIPGSIATLDRVELNGSQQWITIRGHDTSNPILLFLSGGPGGSQLASTRMHLGELEELFTVVNWDQPGAGKSFGAVPVRDLTPQRYVDDGIALIEYLRERFGQQKVYLLGESWGSVLGIWLAQAAPQKIAAVVGSGQMVTFVENDVMGYELALELLEARGQTKPAQKLRYLGPPPYTSGNISFKYMRYMDVLNGYMHARTTGEDHDILRDAMWAPEYTLRDRVNWIRGLMKVFSHVYPQLSGVDLRTDAREIEVPVYMVVGRHDVNAMPVFVEEYYDLLEAPHKELVWFEKSGHPPLYSESDRIVALMERVRRTR